MGEFGILGDEATYHSLLSRVSFFRDSIPLGGEGIIDKKEKERRRKEEEGGDIVSICGWVKTVMQVKRENIYKTLEHTKESENQHTTGPDITAWGAGEGGRERG